MADIEKMAADSLKDIDDNEDIDDDDLDDPDLLVRHFVCCSPIFLIMLNNLD